MLQLGPFQSFHLNKLFTCSSGKKDKSYKRKIAKAAKLAAKAALRGSATPPGTPKEEPEPSGVPIPAPEQPPNTEKTLDDTTGETPETPDFTPNEENMESGWGGWSQQREDQPELWQNWDWPPYSGWESYWGYDSANWDKWNYNTPQRPTTRPAQEHSHMSRSSSMSSVELEKISKLLRTNTGDIQPRSMARDLDKESEPDKGQKPDNREQSGKQQQCKTEQEPGNEQKQQQLQKELGNELARMMGDTPGPVTDQKKQNSNQQETPKAPANTSQPSQQATETKDITEPDSNQNPNKAQPEGVDSKNDKQKKDEQKKDEEKKEGAKKPNPELERRKLAAHARYMRYYRNVRSLGLGCVFFNLLALTKCKMRFKAMLQT